MNLNYDTFSFYAVTVGYENEEQLSIRFYHAPRTKSTTPIEREKLATTDINLLLEANITLFKTKNNNNLQLLTDPDIPHFKIDQNQFSKLLRKVLESFFYSDSILITLKLLVGEHIIIEEKKVRVIQLSVKSDNRCIKSDQEIKNLSDQCHINCVLHTCYIKLEIPLIQ
jgi:hypothetical protein